MYNDSLIYNDDAICLQYGIYKQGVIADENKNSVIIVKPNPANEYVFVKIICNSDEKFNIQIVDAYGRIVCKENLSCNKENKIITRELSQGVYTLLVKTTKGNKTYKIAIVR